ncbi:rhomboid family intramembrane serine protease [Spirilliplanes yamanashiensis]|uniref:Rhomboid family intramembrane serine protease n=1 Tax=Spirilliplanes yamanashiensis TaxID=42233 RepID=A0A8J4DIZ0_9ACTN|nr:rhomboid family intramembrane serine protease [Spirilliplanes yamanashiensis]
MAEGRRTQRQARTAFGGSLSGQAGYVTKALIGLNLLAAVIGVVIAGIPTLIGNGLFTGVTAYQAMGAVTPFSFTLAATGELYQGAVPGIGTVFPGIDDGGFYRLVTAMFIHYGLVHLLFNMYALWQLGRQLETVLGPARFAALYLIAGLGGNVAVYLLDPGGLGAGASTALFGLFAGFFVILRRLGRDTSGIVALLVMNVIITFLIPNLSWEGHIGGLVTGGVVAAALAYAPRERRTPVQVAGCAAVVLLLVVVTAARALTA